VVQINVNPDIQAIPIALIKPFAGNPGDITAEALQGLCSSLEKFGYINPLVVNKRNMEIVSGHQRYKVMWRCEGGKSLLGRKP